MKVWEKVVTGVVSVGVLAGASALGVGMVTAMNANTTEPAVVRTVGFGTAGSFDRGAAIETAVADKTAREAEAARVLAEQAAVAAEAARVAAEQQAAIEQAAAEEAPAPEAEGGPGEPEAPTGGGLPAGAVPPNVPGSDQPDSTACASSALVWDGSQSVCA